VTVDGSAFETADSILIFAVLDVVVLDKIRRSVKMAVVVAVAVVVISVL